MWALSEARCKGLCGDVSYYTECEYFRCKAILADPYPQGGEGVGGRG